MAGLGMSFEQQFAGGEYAFDEDRPRFRFRARQRAPVEQLLRAMYVELSLRVEQGGLAWWIELPDRCPRPWRVPVAAEHLSRLAREAEASGCATVIEFEDTPGVELDLSAFSAGLREDWSGGVARARAALIDGRLEAAEQLLAEALHRDARLPAAHHLLGRCLRARGELEPAQRAYLEAVRCACDGQGRLLPYAAGPLADLGVALKRAGCAHAALQCLLRSLNLRPNNPEALLTFFSLFPTDEKLVLFGAARALAVGSGDRLVEEYLCNYATASGGDVSLLLPLARGLAQEVDLERWPFASEEFGRLDQLERALSPEG